MPIRLAFSLHAPEDALRSRIMPVNDRYPLAEVLAACERYYAVRRRMVFIEYVMLAGVNDSYAQAVQLAQLLDPQGLQGQPDPVQPDRRDLRGLLARGDRRVQGRPRGARDERHRAPHPRPRHRRRLRAARRQGLAGDVGALARSSPARSRRSRSAASSSGRGSQAEGSGRSSTDLQPEQLQEQRRRAVEHGAELRAAGLLDQPAVGQRGGRRLGGDAADPGHLGAGDRLQVGDDRQRLGLRGRQRRRARAREQPPRGLLGVRVRGEREPARRPRAARRRGRRARGAARPAPP